MANTMSKYGSNTNRPLSEIVGLSTDTKPTDSIEGIQIQNGSSFRELDTGKKFLFDAENTTWNEVSSGGGGGGSTLIEKSISANGVYNASDDSADGYSKVTVDVPNTYTAEDEGKVVDNGALVAQTAMSSEVTENGTVDTTLYNSVTVNVPSGGGSNDLADLIERDITSIDIPSSVTSIGAHAFNGCSNLTSVTIPNLVTSIGNNAFYGCSSLTSIDIPSSVTSIGSNAFINCSSLKSVTISNGVTSIDTNTFNNCSSLTSVTIPSSVTSIGDNAFINCSSLKSVTISNGVTSIGNYAFSYCAIESITIPSSVTSIGNYAFLYSNSLRSIIVNKAEGSISGAPWGASRAIVTWTG